MAQQDIEAVRVVVRARPLSQQEIDNGAAPFVHFLNESQVRCGDRFFTYDHTFDSAASQVDVYNACAEDLLRRYLEGYNCTILAYGQTGAGKTFTMGTETHFCADDMKGIIPRVAEALFSSIESSDCPKAYRVTINFLEVYCSEIRDLLSAKQSTQLVIRELPGAVTVQGLTEEAVSNVDDLLKVLQRGCAIRTTGSTAMNATSSRSHAIFTINLTKKAVGDNDCGFKSKFQVVDLAGSERLRKTQAEGERMKEGININRGLLVLGKVISSLADGKSHVPYRDSKITRILRDSLGGNSCTVLIACVSPADVNADETISTLTYADRAKRIKNVAVANIDPVKAQINNLRNDLQEARLEIATLKEQLNSSFVEAESREKIDEEIEALKQQLEACKAERHLEFAQRMRCEERLSELYSVIAALRKFDADNNNVSEDIRSLIRAVKTESGESVMNEDVIDDGSECPDLESANTRNLEIEESLRDTMAKLKQKEELCKTILCEEQIQEDEKRYAQKLQQLRVRLSEMEDERNHLSEEIERLRKSNQISESRRQRLLEVEKELLEHKKRIKEIGKLQAENKRKAEEAMQMRAEITILKQAKMRYLKESRAESARLAKTKAEYERRIAGAAAKERKEKSLLIKMNRSLEIQNAVYKRKLEEAQAANKRLAAQIVKSSALNKSNDQLQDQLNEDLALVRAMEEARMQASSLMKQRAVLTQQLAVLTAKQHKSSFLNTPITSSSSSGCSSASPPQPPKLPIFSGLTRAWSSSFLADNSKPHSQASKESCITSQASSANSEEIQREIERMHEQIAQITKEVSCLQQEVNAFDIDLRIETALEKLASVDTAKNIIRTLFLSNASALRSVFENALETEDLKAMNAQLMTVLDETKEKHAKDTNSILSAHESFVQDHKKMSVMLCDRVCSLLSSFVESDKLDASGLSAVQALLQQLETLATRSDTLSQNVAMFERRETLRNRTPETSRFTPWRPATPRAASLTPYKVLRAR